MSEKRDFQPEFKKQERELVDGKNPEKRNLFEKDLESWIVSVDFLKANNQQKLDEAIAKGNSSKSLEKSSRNFEEIRALLVRFRTIDFVAGKDDLLNLLEEWLDETESEIGNSKENEDSLFEDIDNINNTIKYIKNLNEAVIGRSKQWKLEQDRRAESGREKSEKKERGVETESNKERVEKIKEELLVQEILKEGGILVNTSLPEKYSQTGYHGFSSLCSKNRLDYGSNTYSVDSFLEFERMEEEKEFHRNKISEAVLISPLTSTILQDNIGDENKKEKGWKSFFGNKKKSNTERQVVPAKHCDYVKNGYNDSAVKVSYKTFDFNESYQDYSRRSGQYLLVEMILPQNVSEEFSEKIKDDPEFLRRVVEAAMVREFKIDKDAWTKGNENTNDIPLRPPYEKWADESNGKSKLFIKDLKGEIVVEF